MAASLRLVIFWLSTNYHSTQWEQDSEVSALASNLANRDGTAICNCLLGFWTIPRERMKRRNPHLVFLS